MIARAFAKGGIAYVSFLVGTTLGVIGGSVLTSLAFLAPTLFQAARLAVMQ